jgi:hypothetical protein
VSSIESRSGRWLSQVGATQVESFTRPLRLIVPVDGIAIVVVRGEESFHVRARKRLPGEGIDSLPDVGRDCAALGEDLRALGGDLRLLPPGLATFGPPGAPGGAITYTWLLRAGLLVNHVDPLLLANRSAYFGAGIVPESLHQRSSVSL